jgi:hypothetical protein
LCSLARACKFFQVECEKHIYTTIDLLHTDDLCDILKAFTRRPERIAAVETLNIVYRFHDGISATLDDRKNFNVCVPRMTALKNWHIESPFDNFKWERNGGREWVEQDMQDFRKALDGACFQLDNGRMSQLDHVGLSKLEKLVIHSHGQSSDFWDLDNFHCLFRHPTLRSLHASCFVLPTDLPELGPYAKSTALATLIFDECTLTAKSLGCILRTPKDLKNLTLGENVYNSRPSTLQLPRLTDTSEASLEALMAVSHSLESLTHFDPTWKSGEGAISTQRSPTSSGLRDLHHLDFLDIDASSFLHQFLLSHKQGPPNLETLRIHHALYSDTHGVASLFEESPACEPYTDLESLKTLEFVQSGRLQRYSSQPEYICQPEALRERHACGYKLFKHGINLKVYLEASPRGYMPPYLYGEQKPELISVYDAAQVGFRRVIRHDIDYPMEAYHAFSPEDLAKLYHLHDNIAPGQEARLAAIPPETDQLNTADIVHLRNQVQRSIDAVLHREDDDWPRNVILIDSDDSDANEDDGWFDAEDLGDDVFMDLDQYEEEGEDEEDDSDANDEFPF